VGVWEPAATLTKTSVVEIIAFAVSTVRYARTTHITFVSFMLGLGSAASMIGHGTKIGSTYHSVILLPWALIAVNVPQKASNTNQLQFTLCIDRLKGVSVSALYA